MVIYFTWNNPRSPNYTKFAFSGKRQSMKPFDQLPPSVQEELSRGTRAIFVRTYATSESLERALDGKGLSSYAYIMHDKDGCEPHLHVVMLADRSRRGKDMYAWLKDCVDEKGQPCNSEVEIIKSMDACHRYLTHSDDTSKQKGKHQYAEQDIIYPLGEAPWDYKTPTDVQFQAKEKRKASEDENEQLINDIIARTPSRQMARKYGRDYMKNHKAYKQFAAEILLEEGGSIDAAFALTESIMDTRIQKEMKDSFEMGTASAVAYIRQRVSQGLTFAEAVLEIERRFM